MSAHGDSSSSQFELGTVSENYAQIKQQLRDIYDALCELAYEIITSKTTQKTVLYSVLGTTASVIFYGVAIVVYLFCYHRYLPDQVTTVPLHLQYGYGPNPYGISPLTTYNLKPSQPYDISVTLNLPRSPTNLYRENGNFMVALHLLNGSPEIQRVIQPPVPPLNIDNPLTGKPGGPDIAAFITPIPLAVPDPISHLTHNKILFSSTRAAVIPYIDPLVAQAKRVMFLGYHVLFPEHAEMVTLQVPLAEKVQFPRRGGKNAAGLGLVGDGTPTSMLVEVQAGQNLQVYEASVTITAKLNGLRWFMYHHRLVSFLVGTGLFWAAEVVLMVVGWGVGGYLLGRVLDGSAQDGDDTGRKGTAKGKRKVARIQQGSTGTGDGYDPEHETDEESTMSDTERTFPSRPGAPPLKYEPGTIIKSEEEEKNAAAAIKEEEDEEDDDLYDLPVHLPSVMEAGHEFRDSGIGTSGYSDVSGTTAVGSGSGSAATTRNRRGRKE
ncbi:putative adipose-regulatory protein-domain-containing protein [Copromyces sp. CBS 386.78]|nr:putative adipose-regulatory protein-domain-containing protein [Copromyces sp. CBS 386.78]